MNAKRPNMQDTVFHACAPVMVKDCKTGQMLRLDGSFKTPEGRTLFYALSSPASILRPPGDLEIPRGQT